MDAEQIASEVREALTAMSVMMNDAPWINLVRNAPNSCNKGDANDIANGMLAEVGISSDDSQDLYWCVKEVFVAGFMHGHSNGKNATDDESASLTMTMVTYADNRVVTLKAGFTESDFNQLLDAAVHDLSRISEGVWQIATSYAMSRRALSDILVNPDIAHLVIMRETLFRKDRPK